MRIRKKPFLLLEMCLALGLSALILTTLFSGYVTFCQVDARLKKMKESMLERGAFAAYFQKVFETIPEATEQANLPKQFYTRLEKDNEQIFFIFDAGANPSPLFSGPLYGSLLVDETGALSLLMWPLEKSHQLVRKVPLIGGVKELRFTCFTEDSKEMAWKNLPENGEIPSMLKISFLKNGEPLSFAFFLPKEHLVVPAGKAL
ncbi:MAG: hypothetical protein AAGI90_03545 [Chlamydiota bacterium]